ncbi:tetratricopeptide repeat protein [Bacillus cereus group sp. TH153LC]|uniref:tetratricopeptide repeat protein n=1 Tax=Bacillus cereus group sp. TH153LC TaxID=3018059 RepID=UPI0022E3E854|nr:tetratricopeptide repeat protein [Bacillus cereus group sp. TH153LC]MDA1663087.1 tetratricopeptide repeat protein [Bacillus cereus group sp. TH153LC]
MNISLKGHTYTTKHLEAWYHAILTQNVKEAQIQFQEAKKEHEEILLKETETIPLYQLYYALLQFRHTALTDGLSISKDSFQIIEDQEKPEDKHLSYLYHYYKAIHLTAINKYQEADEYFLKAQALLSGHSQIEQADFYYRFATYHYHQQQPSFAIVNASKALEIFEMQHGCERNISSCLSVLGASYADVGHFEQAEESYNKALDILQKLNEESLQLFVRGNLGLLYASQNLSEEAIRHLTQVIEKLPSHYKAIFLLAQEHEKLGLVDKANHYIKIGKQLISELDNEEYKHHFAILEVFTNQNELDQIEPIVLKGIEYLNRESLYSYVSEYLEKLALAFYNKQQHEKASLYFFNSTVAKKSNERGLKK